MRSFVPVVAAPALGGGECEADPADADAGNERIYSLVFPNRLERIRTVSVAIGPDSRMLRYNDVRGDLRLGDAGPRTMVVIDFERQAAFAMNESPGSPPHMVAGKPEAFLELGSLGTPSGLIQLIRSRCGAP